MRLTVCRLLCALGLVATMAVSGPVAASETLTDADVKRFAASMTDLQEVAERHRLDELATEHQPGQAISTTPMSDAVAQLRGHAAYSDATAVMRRHGFADSSAWGQVGDRVFRAYMAISIERESPDAHQEMQRALAEIEQNPQLSEEQRRMMREMMAGAMGSMQAAIEAPAADKAAVAANLDAVERAFGER